MKLNHRRCMVFSSSKGPWLVLILLLSTPETHLHDGPCYRRRALLLLTTPMLVLSSFLADMAMYSNSLLVLRPLNHVNLDLLIVNAQAAQICPPGSVFPH